VRAHVIETARLRLAPFQADEAGELHRLWMEPPVRRFLWDDRVIPPEQTAAIVRDSLRLFATDGFGLWSLRLRETGELVGFGGFWHFRDPPELELLLGLAEARWGRGLAAEAGRALVRFAFAELGFDEARGSTDAPNRASVRVMEKLGMELERRETVHGLDTVFYAIRRAGWRPDGAEYRVQPVTLPDPD
jgi:RimJ/RimL family protein N-acetyltransferase